MKGQKRRLKKNDLVMVIAGKEKGKSGRILQIFTKKDRAIVEKINFIKRHQRPAGQQRQGGIIEKEGSLHLSNLMLICESCNKPVRIGIKQLEDGKRARYCKKCGEMIDK
ncbi:MAG: 50S ribosomal protein L24 [Deltaproteobacteria bacterium]|nr:50S ribosomal protein L24 [Deltaproteobacteria bacterium]MBW2120735.1 50S ribosomal protein L24 [Deltaproteobacteria bacterium]